MACAGCAIMRQPGAPPEQPPGTGAVVIDSTAEVQIGRSMAQWIVAPQYTPWDDAVEQRRANETGRRIAVVSDRRDIIYHFQILDIPGYDAFALPGGFVYFSRGLYEDLDDLGRAAVLAHEIAHVAARHAVEHVRSALGDEVLVGLIWAGLRQKDPQVSRLISGASDAVFDLLSRGYSRKEELEADALAVKYLARAGYDPYGMATVLEFLVKHRKKEDKLLEMLHAPVGMAERIRRVKKEARGAVVVPGL